MKIVKLAAIGLLSMVWATAFAQTAQMSNTEASIKKLIEPRLGGQVKVVSVAKTPYAGLYEVRTDNNDILYTDQKAQYLFVGRVLNTTTYEDYTRARVDEITRIKFSDLPFDASLKTVNGNGKRVIAIFEDPNCGYCKRFRHTLQSLDNVTIYTFMYNILGEDSVVKSRNIWCSADRMKAWDEWMLNNKVPAQAPNSCMSTPNEKIFALGQKLKFSGTPTIFFADGSRVAGAVDLKTLESKFASLK